MPNSALETVSDYLTDVRTLLLDTVQPYRYDDPSLLVGLNVTIMEARRLRPDLFVYTYHDKLPQFFANDNTPFEMEQPFRLAFVYGICSHAFSRDQEDVQDQRAATFMAEFRGILTGVSPPPIQGGSAAQPQQRAQQ